MILQLSLTVSDSPSNISKTIQNVDVMVDKIESVVTKYNSLSEDICNHLEETDIVRKTIGDFVDRISTLEYAVQYINTIQEIDELRYNNYIYMNNFV